MKSQYRTKKKKGSKIKKISAKKKPVKKHTNYEGVVFVQLHTEVHTPYKTVYTSNATKVFEQRALPLELQREI